MSQREVVLAVAVFAAALRIIRPPPYLLVTMPEAPE